MFFETSALQGRGFFSYEDTLNNDPQPKYDRCDRHEKK